ESRPLSRATSHRRAGTMPSVRCGGHRVDAGGRRLQSPRARHHDGPEIKLIGAEGFMNRRDVLRAGVATGVMELAHRPLVAEDEVARVMTVRGPITPEQMGTTLPHEHVLVDFIGAAKVSRDRYDADEVFKTVLPHLRRIREQGVRTLVECTPAYLGR